MPTRPLSDAQMLRAVTAVKAQLAEQDIETYRIANGSITIDRPFRLHDMITAIANALVSWPEQAPRGWAIVERINTECGGEGWALFVCGDGMIVIDHDADSDIERMDPYGYVKERSDAGSMIHHIALGLHGMVMTEEN